jgi:hypothetical protein
MMMLQLLYFVSGVFIWECRPREDNLKHEEEEECRDVAPTLNVTQQT